MRLKHFLQFVTCIAYCLTQVESGPYAQSTTRNLDKIGSAIQLTSSYPNTMIQDSKGFLWVGTNNGLNRYDGYKNKVFKFEPDNENSISDNWVSHLLEDSEGNIWIGTEGGGLNLYQPATGMITRLQHDPKLRTSISSNTVQYLYEDHNERLWIGTKKGLNLLDKKTLTFQRWEQPSPCDECGHAIKSIAGDSDGNIWIGDEYNGLYCFSPQSETFTQPHLRYEGAQALPSEFINDLKFIEGKLWVGTDNGLAILNAKKQRYETIYLADGKEAPFSDQFIWRIYPEKQGSIWICTNGGGLLHYKQSTGELTTYKNSNGSGRDIGSNSIADVYIDFSENVWVAIRGSGVKKFNQRSLVFQHWKHEAEDENSLVNNNVRAIFQDKDRSIWIGTNDGLSHFNPATGAFQNYVKDFAYKADAKTPKIRSIFRSRNDVLWVGTQNGGLYQYHPASDQFKLAPAFANSPIASKVRHIETIHEVEDGTLWMGTMGTGFITYDVETGAFRRLSSKNDTTDLLLNLNIYCILEASPDQPVDELWVGTNKGLLLLNIETLHYTLWEYTNGCQNCPLGNRIRSLFRHTDGKIWIGSRSGLSIFDPEKKAFQTYTSDQSLPTEVIYGIMPGVDGNIWLTTTNGLIQIDPKTMETTNLSIAENNTLDMGGHAIGYDGFLLLGGIDGFTMFHPGDLSTNSFVPQVVLTDIKVNNQSISPGRSIPSLQSIDLSYQENNLTFEFSALEFTHSAANTYQYQLKGFANEWVDLDTKHDVTFTNLDPKTYTLNIKGSNNEGLWNKRPTSLTIRIRPPWWNTFAFKALTVTGIIGALLSFYFTRVWRLKQSEEHLQLEVQKQTERLVKTNKELEMLHDEKDGIIKFVAHDLRSPLAQISGFSQLLSRSEELSPLQQESIEMINLAVKNADTLITDLLFIGNVNHSTHTVDMEQFDLGQYLEEWEKKHRIGLKNKDQQLQKYSDSGSHSIYANKEMVGRIFDNLMTNAIKFSNKGSVIELSITKENDRVKASIRDYGPGMTADDKKKAFGMFQKLSARPTDGESSHGLGLAIVKTLAKRMQASVEIESELGKGTTFILRFQQPQHRVQGV